MEVNKSYPFNQDYEYESKLTRINLDEERENDLRNNKGFIVSEHQSIKKDIKMPNGIFSTKYGQTLQDVNPYADRYKCECGYLTGRIYKGTKCKVCNTDVKYIDDDFNYFGWMILKDPYYIIHPNLFKSLEFLIGSTKLNNIIDIEDHKDQNGHSIKKSRSNTDEYKIKNTEDGGKDEPFYGIGMIDFKERFQEILDYYYAKVPDKKDYYEDIMAHKDIIFIQSIPVYTTHLRPFKIDMENFFFEGTNAIYNMMSKLVSSINRDQLKIYRKKKPKNQLLYDLQTKYNDLYTEIEKICQGKKGVIRTAFGGRYSFSARNVIVPNPKLRIDQVILPYHALVELLQQTIINILKKSYNMSYSDAYDMWYKAQVERNEIVYEIIKGIINNHPEGVPILINRNPSISYGAILQMFCVGINDNYCLEVPLQILAVLAADFDGDVLNILYIINRVFFEQANMVFNPRNCMYISRNDGKFSNTVNHSRDTLINANSLINLSRKYYTQEQLNRIREMQNIV